MRRSVARLAFALLIVWPAQPARADEPSITLLRVFLNDGTALASFGEYARVGDRVVFSLLLASGPPPRLQLVNLPASVVDWTKTSRYADAARYERYISTRAQADYVALTNQVAAALSQILAAQGNSAKLELAQRTRRLLAEWPAQHYSYRSRDVQEMSGLLDEAISEMQAASGERSFAINLVAAVDPPDTRVLLPSPTLAESIEQALAAANATDLPSERLALLRTVDGLVDEGAASLPAGWIAWARGSVRRVIEVETKIEREYARIVRRLLGRAGERAERADVRGVESVVREARREDTRLGGRRPDQMNALFEELERRLNEARRLRLARDQWALNVDRFRMYRQEVSPLFDEVDRSRAGLEQIRSLAGPAVRELDELLGRLQAALSRASAVGAPADLRGVHATLVSALQLGANAARLRQAAAASADLNRAWDASAAAAGSLMLAARARSELDQTMRPPRLQ